MVTLIEKGTKLYAVAIYIGKMTRFYVRVKDFVFNIGVVRIDGSPPSPAFPYGLSPSVDPFLRIGHREHPFIKFGGDSKWTYSDIKRTPSFRKIWQPS